MSGLDHDRIGRADLYRRNILDHSRKPRNKRMMDDATVSRRDANMSCGDDVEMFVRIEGDRLAEISFVGQGCAISQAATSMLTEKLCGLTVAEALNFSRDDLMKVLGVDVGPSRLKCAMLGLQTLQKALKKYSE